MKILTALILLLACQLSFAKASPAVNHTHNGRTHSHSLPTQGLAHRHGSNALGIAIGISDHTQNASGTTIQPTKSVTKNAIKGRSNCRRSDADCNVCAANVQLQFQRAAFGQISWHSNPWRFIWPQQYPPFNKRPLDFFDGDAEYALGIPDKHVQGFVKTNSARFPYAGSHSHKRQGSIFVIAQKNDGKKFLSTLHPSESKHPSSVHILGKYLIYGDNSTLVFKDLNSPNQQHNIKLKVPGPKVNFGGGLGLIKLTSHRHLLILSGPGGQDKRPRFHRFYYLDSLHGRPHQLTFISQSAVTNPTQWSSVYVFSENLTAITECGSGDIYTIHTSGDEKGVSAIRGRGYWRLSKLEHHQNELQLRPISAFSSRQNMASCHIRAAATVYVTPQHQLEFYCHGYAKDPDGSTFNVLGNSSRGADRFYFKVGVPR